MSSVL
jgi:hypothetical protein